MYILNYLFPLHSIEQYLPLPKICLDSNISNSILHTVHFLITYLALLLIFLPFFDFDILSLHVISLPFNDSDILFPYSINSFFV